MIQNKSEEEKNGQYFITLLKENRLAARKKNDKN